MTRAKQVVGASLLILTLTAGCKLTDFSFLAVMSSSGGPREQVVAGSIDGVAATAQASLSTMGLVALSNREGEAVRIESMTREGKRFALVLTRQQTEQGEQTRIRIEWEKGGDEGVEGQVFALLTAQLTR